MCQLVAESLKFVRIKSHIITDHIVWSWGHSPLTHWLGHKVEVIPA